MWPSLIKKAKEGGLNTIETYVFWNAHEPKYRQYDFSGNNDLIKFLKTIRDKGLYTILRIGPYVCAEWNYGGFPVWLHNMPNMTMRTYNEPFMREMSIFTKKIVDMVKKEKLFASQGGNIILAQIENEYGNINSHYGEDGQKYLQWCAKFALSLNIGVPWIMCQEEDAPQTMIITCNGFYCDQYSPKYTFPKFWTENWTGWFKTWGGRNPYRPPEDLAFAVARFFQYGGSLQNYYMYHGGTNFGRTAGGPFITTSYDYNAPLDEYGNLNQPKYGHLKELHKQLYSFEDILLYGDATHKDEGNKKSSSTYNHNGKRVCFLGNQNEVSDTNITFEGNSFTVPAWSVTILKDCKTEVYNTAKINVKKPKKVMKTFAKNLKWSFKPEPIMHLKYEHGDKSKMLVDNLNAPMLYEQKHVTNDSSDYLWYMTSFNMDDNSEVSLHVDSKGHVLHVFLNDKHIGSEWGSNGNLKISFDAKIKPIKGLNAITLLSETVGLTNYGAFFDKVEDGVEGPVTISGPNGQRLDLSKYNWTYMIGLSGINKGLYQPDPKNKRKWHTKHIPTNQKFIWYKTTFKTPPGDDVVVLNLSGMSKGVAWVNGHSIGRYWPSAIAENDGCKACDYRGPYHGDKKCLSGCGRPSQQRYHVPRSFLSDGGKNNELVLFEEWSGQPQQVNLHTIHYV